MKDESDAKKKSEKTNQRQHSSETIFSSPYASCGWAGHASLSRKPACGQTWTRQKRFDQQHVEGFQILGRKLRKATCMSVSVCLCSG
jgi:hypothetical protein